MDLSRWCRLTAIGPDGCLGERWVLEGERAELAVPVTVDQVGERLEALLEPSGKAADQPG